MIAWSVLITLDDGQAPALEPAGVEGLARLLAPHGAAISIGDGTTSIRLAVDAPDVAAAINTAAQHVRDAERQIRNPIGTITHVEATEWSKFEAELEQPNFPDLLGVTEVAELLDVSRQRAHQLANRQDFPEPIVRLAGGPVWTRGSLERFLATWDRKVGRPATTKRDGPTIIDRLPETFAAMKINPGDLTKPGLGGYGMKITGGRDAATVDYFANMAKLRPTDPNAAALGLLLGLVMVGVLEWRDRRRNALALNATAAAGVTFPGDLADVINLAERLAARHAGQVPMHEFAIEVGADVPTSQLKAQLSTELDHHTGA